MAQEKETESVSSVKFVVDKISFVNKFPTLNKATSDDARPTAGYLYQEISNISYERGSYCSDLLDYLVGRLEKPSYHVKLKVLRVMRFLVDNGHTEFRQGLRRKAHGIREATKFGGPPDPLHGNAPYILVRKEAKELCSVLFDIHDESERKSPAESTATAATMGGMGSGATNTMQGFGNVPMKEKSLTESIVGGLLDFAGKVTETRITQHGLLGSHDSQDKHFSSYKPVHFSETTDTGDMTFDLDQGHADGVRNRTKGHHSQAATISGHKTRKINIHRPGKAGGGWDDSDDDEATTTPKSGTPQGTTPRSTTPLRPASSTGSAGRVVVEDLPDDARSLNEGSRTVSIRAASTQKEDETSAEFHLVMEIVNLEDELVKRKDIQNFVKRCPSLNCARITELIGETLTKSSNNHQLHGLQLVEALIRTDLVTPDEVAANCCDGLDICYKNRNNQIHTKARKVIRILEKLCSEGSVITSIIPALPRSSEHVDDCDPASPACPASALPVTVTTPDANKEADMTSSNFSFIKAPFAQPQDMRSATASVTSSLIGRNDDILPS